MYQRDISHHYSDPVSLIWIQAAKELGLSIQRSNEVFASYDGKGTLTIANADDFDADDCLAQMIFHEICHWLVAGRRGYKIEDWGLSNTDDSDVVYENAAIRLQTSLAQRYGLRDFMAVTTDWRPYWNALPDDPLQDGEDPAIVLAQQGYDLSRKAPFHQTLHKALLKTASIADIVKESVDTTSLWSLTRSRHRLGSLSNLDPALRCGSCAWSFEVEYGIQCRQHSETSGVAASVEPDEVACDRWEPVFSIDDCGTCGACCHRGFDVLAVADGDEFRSLHPELIQLRDDGEHCVPRPDGICVALEGDGNESTPYRCRHYATRPQNCRDFEVAGDACLVARRRVGLSK